MFSDSLAIVQRGCATVDAPLWSWLFHATGNEARAAELHAETLVAAGRALPRHVWREGGGALIRGVLRMADEMHHLSGEPGASLSDSTLGKASTAREKVLTGLRRMSGDLRAALLLRETAHLEIDDIAAILDRSPARVRTLLADARADAFDALGDAPPTCSQQAWSELSALFDDTPADTQTLPQEHVAFCTDCIRTWHSLDRLRTVMVSLAAESGRADRVAKSVVRSMPSSGRAGMFLAVCALLVIVSGGIYVRSRASEPTPMNRATAPIEPTAASEAAQPAAPSTPPPAEPSAAEGEKDKPLTEAQARGFAGVWRLDDGSGAKVGEFIVAEEGEVFLMYAERREEALENLVAHGIITGAHLQMDESVPLSGLGGLEGTLSEDGNTLPLTRTGDSKAIYVLTRVPGEKTSGEQALEKCMATFAEMMGPLERYAADHHGAYPEQLEELAPGYVGDLSLYREDERRRVKYQPGLSSLSVAGPLPAWKNTSPALPLAERLRRGEEDMRARFGSSPLNPVVSLRVEFVDDCVECRASVLGSECGPVPCGGEEETPPPIQNMEGLRIECQENLRHLWMVIQAFREAHDGLTPPGWWTAYPDYLADPHLLTSPKDPPGTDSYVYVLPAQNPDEIVVPSENDGEPAVLNPWMAPMLINDTDFPGSPAVRNVLFADGHVESIATNSDAWRDRIAPFLPTTE